MRILVDIDVPDLDPAIAFYREALGLRLSRLLDDDVAELSGASSTIYLLRKPAGSAPAKSSAAARDYARHWTPVHLDFVVDDLAAAERRAVGAGARRESECIEWKGSKCITFSDPFGHGFCLIKFASQTYEDGDGPAATEAPI
ncbi:MAG TPA: VOC family protein [Gammaproteobacteria bacterium]|nr:VOC family protein [Gammaproteobacteria bacterium]